MHCTSAREDFVPLYFEAWGEMPQSGSITIKVLHGTDGVIPVTVPLNDSMSSLMTIIAAQLAATRLAAAEKAAAAPADSPASAVAGGSASDEVTALLSQLKLSEWVPQLLQMGATEIAHLRQLEDADLVEIGMPRLHRRSLLKALGTPGTGTTTSIAGRAAIVDELEGGEVDALVRTGSVKAAFTGSWEFDDAPNGWKPLAPEAQAAVEAAHAAGTVATVQVTVRQWTYDIDLRAMTQTNTKTGKVRALRRIE